MEIRKITSDEWQTLKDIRLKMLHDKSIDFDYSSEEIVNLSEADWREKIEGSEKITLVAFEKNKPIGTVRAFRENMQRKNHVAIIRGLYVCEEFRDKGFGKSLMISIMDEIKNSAGIVKARLEVAVVLKNVIMLYESLGFEIVGTLKKELKSGSVFTDKYIMELFF